MMRKITQLLLLILLSNVAKAQIHEIGIFAGGSNFIGDVGSTTYISPNSLAIGALYKWNKSPRYSWRLGINHSIIKNYDSRSDILGRKLRQLGFDNTITEVTAGFEFNFFDFNLHTFGYFGTPYLYTGLSYFRSKDLYVVNNQYFSDGSSGSLAFPIVAGYKFKIANSFVLAAESGVRLTFSDDLDGSFPKNSNFESLKFGNTNSNDWYVFTGLTLTYTFGNKPCYCRE